jgi:hypothetical protein
MATQATFTAHDPRDLSRERTLDIEFTIESFGSPANTYGLPEDCDPGEPAEICLDAARDITGANVLSLLTTEQQEAIEAEVLENYEFDRAGDFEPCDGDW